MKRVRFFIYLLVIIQLFFCLTNVNGTINTVSSSQCRIIPLPEKMTIKEGVFYLNSKTNISYSNQSLKPLCEYLQREIRNKTGVKINKLRLSAFKNTHKCIYLNLVKGYAEEAYKIEVYPNKIICKASTEAGLFYALQSLLQSINFGDRVWSIQSMLIEDSPRFSWRGFMLDESRHFFGKEVVMQYIDLMSKLKLNRFHWHLSDEPGWRIEIKKYPLLTQIGSVGNWSDSKAKGAFYSQEDIKEIVKYASERHVMIIPEIDMPGHATQVSRSYPELSGGGTGRWNGFTLNPAKEVTYNFISDLFDELITLFPSPYIHIGGDEVHYGNQSWFTDSIIQKFISDKNLNDEIDLEHYFVKRVNKIVYQKEKVMIGWDEVVNIKLNPENVKVMWWRHDRTDLLKIALENKFNVIMCPRLPCYFDFVQHEKHEIGRKAPKGKTNNLQSVYYFPDNQKEIIDIINGYENHVLGIQANIWTENVKDKERLDFMTFPRLIALSEAAWSKKDLKDFMSFQSRLRDFMQILNANAIYYFNIFENELTPEPWGPTKKDVIAGG